MGPLGARKASALEPAEAGRRLAIAYPDAIAGVDGATLVWRDGTRMPIDDGNAKKSAGKLLESPDLEDIFAWAYPAGAPLEAPNEGADPGRTRPAEFFAKLYGDCRRGEIERDLVAIDWLPAKSRQRIRVSSRHGVAERLAAISAELDRLPAEFDAYLLPAAGTYNCRAVAGTQRTSAHGYGIAIDIAIARSDYWRWAGGTDERPSVWRNRIPAEIVAIFEKHGFIWGGRWHHFDTMHFEYRPELFLQPQGNMR